jgi:altronate hydrolase
MLPAVNETKRELCSVSDLVLGVKCGASDAFSGISANPSLGRAADKLVSSGGTVLITEVPEFCGAEHMLAHRAKDAETGRAVYGIVDWYKAYAKKFGAAVQENPSPGNVEGGLLNITIKSLGAIAKAGTTRVEGVVEYGEPPKSKGLHLMQGPGYDQESTPALVAGGATVVVFTTGRGSTIGNAIVPVIKLASNSAIFRRMSGDLDLSAGGIIDGVDTIDGVAERLFDYIRQTAGGEIRTKAEEVKHREFQVWSEQAVSL